jgi:hypothetical protein
VELVHSSRPTKKAALALALGALALAALVLALGGAGAPRAAAATACPSFRVLHNDRIGPASLPAGNYSVTPAASSGLSCAAASQLFTRFLEDYDGILPRPWRVIAQGSGKASFARGNAAGFSVSRSGGGGGDTSLGKLCNGTYTVNATANVGPLFFPRGQYLVYIPPRSGMPCNRARVLFTRFLAQPEGMLPFPWRVNSQIATFYKPAHPQRSAFRIEPLNGAGPA